MRSRTISPRCKSILASAQNEANLAVRQVEKMISGGNGADDKQKDLQAELDAYNKNLAEN